MTAPPASQDMASPRLPHSPRVLLLVDFINPLNFPGGDSLAKRAVEAAKCAADLKARLSQEGVATVYANDNYGVWQSDFHSLVSACLGLSGAPGEIARALYPQASDLTILKPRHSAFFASPLELLLTEMHTQDLVVCGLATDMCVQLTAGDAFLREFGLWVPSDCSAAETPEAHDTAIKYMAGILKCDVRPWRGAASAPSPNGRRLKAA